MAQSPSSARLRLENQVAVVTGGTRGIGEGIVRRFVEEGARVVFSGRSQEKGKAIEKELSPNAEFYRADASSPSDTEALMNFVAKHFGRIDCVVNNAGAGGKAGPIAETSVEEFNQSIALLLGGTFFGIKYSVPHMKAGTIINISSISGLTAGYSPHAYTAAKFGVIGLTKSVALEFGERGIRVNAICPGGVATAIFAPVARELLSAELIESAPDIVEPWLAEGLPLGRSGLPSDIANAALWLASSESSWVTGQAFVIDGGLTAGQPWSQMFRRWDELYERFRSALGKNAATS